jgi:hypothetical protein
LEPGVETLLSAAGLRPFEARVGVPRRAARALDSAPLAS